ncbi:complex I subunit 5 family protein [Halopelagius longus]|uniref:Multicomponent Na+:H+ antiporter subunit D n=1 Tax=Halopelagius longus TaxID=1236180 RepID=A0A1H0Y762_9EURY|nr:proton-conducting transporter membrane subunit [Halopelagius longus]RDI72316.1 Na+/H+ antiporter subunit D [Halopelagius longus]SDQ10967.1 multicomponent Na+:H+ antiporter subunit D [Halopelagius longus]
MSWLVIAPLLAPLGTAVLTLALGQRPRIQRAASAAGAAAYVAAIAAAVWVFVLAPGAPGAAVYRVGEWPAPFGITLVLDGLSAFMLTIAAGVGFASILFSLRYVSSENQRVYYHPLFHVLLVGVTGAFLTGDLFNLFVWFEVMLIVSYVFVAFYGTDYATAASFRYLVMNVLGSALMLVAIGGLYATTGTLNMADMARRLADPAAYGVDPAPAVGLSALLLAVFALKAGLVPFQFWVPAAYTAAPPPITAMFAGVTKKVGMYAIVRLYFTVFAVDTVSVDLFGVAGVSPLAFLAPVLAAMGIASIVVGGFGAVGQDRLEGVFAYSSVGQVGFIAIPIAVAAAADPAGTLRGVAIAAALVFALHHALAKGLLFLSAAAVEDATGTDNLRGLGGVAGRSPVLSGAVFVGLLSLIGLPPLTGFFGKLLAFDATVRGLASGSGALSALALVALLLGAVLTILYTTRVWVGGFWGAETPAVEGATVESGQLAVLVALAAAVVVVGVGFDPIYRFAETAANAAVDTEAYVDIVGLGGGGGA